MAAGDLCEYSVIRLDTGRLQVATFVVWEAEADGSREAAVRGSSACVRVRGMAW